MLSYFTAHIAHLRRQRDSSGYSFDVKVEEMLSSYERLDDQFVELGLGLELSGFSVIFRCT